MEDSFLKNNDIILSTISRLFALEGNAKIVALLASCDSKLTQTNYDNWNGAQYYYTIDLFIDLKLFSQINEEKDKIENTILKCIQELTIEEDCFIDSVSISPKLMEDTSWRDKAIVWLKGDGISNQGRVRSDNIASRKCDGLLFRSNAEIEFYKALKSKGIPFAPLPVFIKGGNNYSRIEPDFFIIKDGIMIVVEVDGDTVHQETPVEAHARTTMLNYEGVHIERIPTSRLNNKDDAINEANKIIKLINKLKEQK